MNDRELGTIAALCRSFLLVYEDVGKVHETERLANRLHEATRPRAVPTLGIHVSDSLAMEGHVGGSE